MKGSAMSATPSTRVAPSAPSARPARNGAPAPQRLEPADRAALGAAARDRVPLESHADLAPATRDPIEILSDQAVTRVPELVPIRHSRMLATPFTFYRGAAAVMAADLAGTPVSGLTAQICGDAHLSNFGMFGSPERRLLFDV